MDFFSELDAMNFFISAHVHLSTTYQRCFSLITIIKKYFSIMAYQPNRFRFGGNHTSQLLFGPAGRQNGRKTMAGDTRLLHAIWP
jgi:hypothetical protein